MKLFRCIPILIVLFGLAPKSTLADNLYIIENSANRMSKYTTDGAIINTNFITNINNPRDLKLDGYGKIYVTSSGGNGIASGGSVFTTSGLALNRALGVLSGNNYSFGLCILDTNLILTVLNNASIPSFQLSGTNVVNTNSHFLSSYSMYSEPIVTDGSYYYMYDTLFGHLQKYNLNGSIVTSSLAVGTVNGWSMCIDGTNLYVADIYSNTVACYSTLGKVISTNLIAGLVNPYGIAADGKGHLFVANYNRGVIGEYSTNGTPIITNLITGLRGPLALAIETTPTLSISQTTNSVLVTWSAFATNYILQSNSDLTKTNWVIDSAVTTTNGTNTATITPPTGSTFFRLFPTNGF